MKEYLKSLFPFRWICPTSLYVIMCIIFICMFDISNQANATITFSLIEKIAHYVLTAILIIVMDYTMGFGRSEKSFKKNMFGMIFSLLILGFYIWYYSDIFLAPLKN